jgi:hypothetical protein
MQLLPHLLAAEPDATAAVLSGLTEDAASIRSGTAMRASSLVATASTGG